MVHVTVWTLIGVLLTLALVNYSVQTACAIELARLYRSSYIKQTESKITMFHDYANVVFHLIHILEYIVLIGSIWVWKTSDTSEITKSAVSSVLRDWWSRLKLLCSCNCTDYKTTVKAIVEGGILILSLIAYTLVIVWCGLTFHDWDQCSRNHTSRVCTRACLPNVSVDMALTYVVRMSMLVITFMVAATWFNRKSQLQRATNLKGLLKQYNTTGEQTSSLHVVFKRWFVLQWLVYFFEILLDLYFVYDSLSDGFHYSDNSKNFELHVAFLSYRMFSFTIPYLCGLTMNYYHRKYCEALNERLQVIQRNSEIDAYQQAGQGVAQSVRPPETNTELLTIERMITDNHQEMLKLIREMQQDTLRKVRQDLVLQTSNLVMSITENPKYHFKPSIYEIGIPLNETAHIMTISFVFVAFILSLVSKSVN